MQLAGTALASASKSAWRWWTGELRACLPERLRQVPERLVAEHIVPHPAREGDVLAEGVEVARHVEGCPAQKETFGKGIPENLADAEDAIAHGVVSGP
jgi:hypothetical protein